MKSATATACANIALVKYWGKRHETLFLPTNGSISLTLDGLYTTTTVTFGDFVADRFVLDGVNQQGADLAKVSRFLDRVRPEGTHALVESENHVPTAAGLASSASAFAALATAATRAAGLDWEEVALSRLARQGSGSACRSIFGGFVEWQKGVRADGLDSHGVPIAGPDHWDVRMLVAVLARSPKSISSREGMKRTMGTSAFYPGWLATVDADLAEARSAILRRDLTALGAVMERSALKMHATMLAANPPFTYLKPASLSAIQSIWDARAEGLEGYFTMDAGPNVKLLCAAKDAPAWQARLQSLPEVTEVLSCGPGSGVR